MTRPLEESCLAFRAGQFDPESESDVRRMLRGEGVKRLESFLFELLMQRALTHYCTDMAVSFGWYVLTSLDLWVRLETESPLGPCDHALIALLTSRRCSVLKVRVPADKFGFCGCWHTGQGWGDELDLDELLRNRFGSRRNVREVDEPVSPDRADALFAQLFPRFRAGELRALALSRLLINCFLSPYARRQPMDLDAVVLNEHGVLRFVEFKRKYPSWEDKFGLDSGHGELIRWLEVTGHTMSNVILVDPCWNKKISPLHLIEGPSRSYAR
jgi:hypothetical protein